MKIMLVSDIHHHSTKHIYEGYLSALKRCKVPHDTIDYATVDIATTPYEIMHDPTSATNKAWGLITAKTLIKWDEITHVFFISGLLVPAFVWQTLKYRGIKTGVIACDDPHSSQTLVNQIEDIDYYFTNEKTMDQVLPKIHYVPTATDHMFPQKSTIKKEYKYDIVFIGNVYPNRIKPLEKVLEYAQTNGLTMKIIGPMNHVPEDSPIKFYGENKIVSNREAKTYYGGAKVVLNLDRNVNWKADAEDNALLFNTGKPPYSLNPRAYEIGGCQTVQLFVDCRQEAQDVFGDSAIYATSENVDEVLDDFWAKGEDEKLLMACEASNIVIRDHLYDHRLLKILNIIREE